MAGGQGKGSKGAAPQPQQQQQQKGKVEKASTQSRGAGGKNQEKQASSGKGKGKEEAPKARYYVKDGKNYSYKVPGSVEVGSVQEAEALMKMQEETIYGLGPGGNVPLNTLESEESSSEEEELDAIDNRVRGETGAGRGRGAAAAPGAAAAAGRGRGKAFDKHHQKDRASKKHFSSLGGY